MKRVLPHPPREKRPTVWRSISELENEPEFEEMLQREFPRGADVYDGSGLSKRDFLKLMGASMALAGVGLSGCRRPASYIVPLKDGVEWTIPGKFLYYATSMPTRMGAIPLIATTVDGRPTKIEGNPLHPYSNGGTDGFAQASILNLYDPNRAKTITKEGSVMDAAAFDAFLAEVREKAAGSGGAGIAILADAANSPTRDRLRDELKSQFPNLLWAEYEPLGDSETVKANTLAFGEGVKVVPQFEKADVILSLDSDFLDSGAAGPKYAEGFYKRRNPDPSGKAMNRLYVAENHYSVTGGMADHRIRVKASKIGAFAAAVGAKIAEKTGNGALQSVLAAQPKSEATFDEKWITECANDLLAHSGTSLVIAGKFQPWHVQALAYAINAALGSLGKTLAGLQTGRMPAASASDLAAAIQQNQIDTLFVLGGNPAYDAPADLAFPELMTKVADTVHVSLFEDETSKVAKWFVPAAHFLETWGDVRAFDGTYTSVQPMILPLWDGISQFEILAQLAGRPKPGGPELIRETFQGLVSTSGQAFDLDWNEFLRKGFQDETAWPEAPLSFNAGAVTGALQSVTPAPSNGTELVFLPSSSVDDGRYANNSWLQETPDFVTKLTWDNAALVSPKDANALGIKDGDMLEISAGGKSIRAAALVAPGHAADSISIALGYGRKDVSALMQNVGFDAYPLRTTGAMGFVTGVSVKPAGGPRYPLAQTQEARSMEGRDLFREGTVEHYKEDPTFAQHMGMDSHLPPEISLYKNPYFQPVQKAKEQWAMTVDLNVCSGCNACLLACQSENNVPVVGKDQVIKGRDMAWIRIDRYFASAPGDESDDSVEARAADPEMLAQMITCQQCENAPCETVCPVNATVHSEDGLNLMAYNRCIGTRYCANNCPWKVRRFNYFDYNERPIDKLYMGPLAKKGMAESLKMAKNPNVTVRMRGVMEKCTFCIQRIEEAKIARLVKAGASNAHDTPIGQFKTACQQACPSDAIVFGDENNPESRVSKLRKDSRGYVMLKYLNARPRITYLARIKNPNPAMPGAERVGNINTPVHHGGHGEEHGAHDAHDAVQTGADHGAEPAHH